MHSYVHLKYSVLNYQAMGCWDMQIKSRFLLFLQKCYFVFSIAISIFMLVCFFMGVPDAYGIGLREAVNCASFGCHFAFNLTRAWTLFLPSTQNLLKKVQVTEKNLLEKSSPEVISLYMDAVQRNYLINKIIMYIIFICPTLYTFLPWIINIVEVMNYTKPEYVDFPLAAWLPFDKYEYYKTAYFIFVLAGIFLVGYSAAGNNLFLGISIFVIGQLKILQHEIHTGIVANKFNDDELYQNMRKAIMHYNNILKFVDQLNGIMKFLMLFQLIIYTVHTALISFEIVTDVMSVHLFENTVYMAATIVELSSSYWFGNEIYLENLKVVDALWGSDWYNCGEKVKKSMLIMMMRAIKPMKLLVGYSYHMSLETLVMLLKSSVSYAIALQKFYELKK